MHPAGPGQHQVEYQAIIKLLLKTSDMYRWVPFRVSVGSIWKSDWNILNNVDDCHLLYFLWHSMVFNWFIFCIFRAAEVKERNKKDKNSVSRLRHCDRTPSSSQWEPHLEPEHEIFKPPHKCESWTLRVFSKMSRQNSWAELEGKR